MGFAKFLFLGILLFSALGFSAEAPRYFVVPSQGLSFFSAGHGPEVVENAGGYSLIRMTPTQAQIFSDKIHTRLPQCGGFLDVQVQMETRGLSPSAAFQWASSRPAVTRLFDKQTPSYPSEVNRVMNLTNVNRMGQFLREFTSFPNRFSRGDYGVKASQWLANRAAALAQSHERPEIKISAIPTGGSYKQDSILVRIPGQNSSLPGVLIGGHMDTLDGQKPGADDDGTGSATVMEIYNAVLDSRIKFQRDLYFAFYAAEELGLYGSQRVVAAFQQRHIPMRGIVQFDMTGYRSKQDPQEMFFVTDHTDQNLTKFLFELTQVYLKIPTNLISLMKCGYACSDHASWTNGGYASAFPFEAPMGHDNPTIHTNRDTMDLLNPQHMNRYVRLGAAFAVESADPVSGSSLLR